MTRPFRFICTQEDPKWLYERTKVITASEVAAFFGEGYKSQKAVLEEKLWSVEYRPRDDSTYLRGHAGISEENLHSAEGRAHSLRKYYTGATGLDADTRNAVCPGSQAWWGLQMERPNMHCFSALSGMRSKAINAFLVSKKMPEFGCTIDGICIDAFGDIGVLEMKNVDQYDLSGQPNGDRWRNGFDGEKPRLPKYRWIQVQGQLYVTGYPYAVLCAKIGACDMVWHTIYPDLLFFEDLEAIVQKATRKLDKLRKAAMMNNEVTE